MLLPKDILKDMEHASTLDKIKNKVRDFMEGRNSNLHHGGVIIQADWDAYRGQMQMYMVSSMATLDYYTATGTNWSGNTW